MSSGRPTHGQPWEDATDPALAYAVNHMNWYRRACKRHRIRTKVTDLVILLSTAATVLTSALHAPALITSLIASVALFFVGFRQVFHPNERWVATGTAWLALEQEIVRYHLTPDSARDDAARQALLDRTAEIVLTETRGWADRRSGFEPLPAPQTNTGAPGSP